MKETDLFQPVKDKLAEIGFLEVYAEVLNRDVVAFKGARTVIIELKKQLSFKVIEQAIEGSLKADYTFVAVPLPKNNHSKLAIQLLKENGIGLIYIAPGSIHYSTKAKIIFWGKRNKRPEDLRKHIKPHHLNTIAGSKSGEGPTEYSDLMDEVKIFLKRRKKWVSIDEILAHVDRVNEYYRKPKESLMATLKANWNTEWCERSNIDRKTHFRYKTD